MQYTKSVKVNYSDLDRTLKTFQPGQWFTLSSGARGQYLGQTKSITVVNWVDGKFDKQHAKANKPLREFAKIYGSK
jgi:hypothetical protein